MGFAEDLDAWYKNKSGRAGQSPTPPWVDTSYQGAAPTNIIGLTSGFTPNYEQLIKSDPAYLSWQNNSQRDVASAAAARKAALQALVVRYGGKGSFTDQYGDVDQNTLDQAAKNEFSDTARLQRNYTQGVENLKRELSGRGALQSGELSYGQDQADLARSTSEYDLNQAYMNAAIGSINDYLRTESGVRAGETGAISQAEQNVYSNPLNRPTEGTEAQLVSGWESKYGEPVYQGPDGQLYRPDGTVYAPKPPVQGGYFAGPTDPNGTTGGYFNDYQTPPPVTAPEPYWDPYSKTWIS